MSLLRARLVLLAAIGSTSFFGISASHADDFDGAYLDAPYPKDVFVPQLDLSAKFPSADFKSAATRNDVEGMIRIQTPVKSQGSRGTCSIFSATAMLESLLVSTARFSAAGTDLSEEWLEYVLMTANYSGTDGSNSPQNFQAFARTGSAIESLLPYLGDDWTTASTQLSARRCAGLQSIDLKRCLLGHRNPYLIGASDAELSTQGSPLFDLEFMRARQSAFELRDTYLRNGQSGEISPADAKRLLIQGVAVTLDIDFFYGAWNHRLADTLGIGRSETEWLQGIVTFPAPGSADEAKSRQKPAGHSILLVGFDDDVVVTTRKIMTDGSIKEFTYRGVYYFKNSWGSGGFGTTFTLGGKIYPGYGMMVQDYPHAGDPRDRMRTYGRFYSLILR